MNWSILLIVMAVILTGIIFFVIRNQKDKQALKRNIIDDNEGSNTSENDTKVDSIDS